MHNLPKEKYTFPIFLSRPRCQFWQDCKLSVIADRAYSIRDFLLSIFLPSVFSHFGNLLQICHGLKMRLRNYYCIQWQIRSNFAEFHIYEIVYNIHALYWHFLTLLCESCEFSLCQLNINRVLANLLSALFFRIFFLLILSNTLALAHTHIHTGRIKTPIWNFFSYFLFSFLVR